ncbi:MAG: hypothetical protein GX804_08470, partial [Lentisphaerae bacterium]|nr:hypothetical protein [Lentisphaerota bacterium]
MPGSATKPEQALRAPRLGNHPLSTAVCGETRPTLPGLPGCKPGLARNGGVWYYYHHDKHSSKRQRRRMTTIIAPTKSFFRINLRELIEYRDLLFLLAKRDIVIVYKQTILGPLWFLIQPVITAVVFTVIFGQVAKIATGGIPH